MKQALLMFVSAMIGGVVGCLSFAKFGSHDGQVLRVREISVVNEEGSVVAKLGTEGTQSSLTFYTLKGTLSVEIGTDRADDRRFLNFWREDRSGVLASLSSRGRANLGNGEATLVLGDNGWEGRTLVGFLDSEIPGAPANGWGLLIPDYLNKSKGALVSAVVEGPEDRLAGSIKVRKSSGAIWSER